MGPPTDQQYPTTHLKLQILSQTYLQMHTDLLSFEPKRKDFPSMDTTFLTIQTIPGTVFSLHTGSGTLQMPEN